MAQMEPVLRALVAADSEINSGQERGWFRLEFDALFFQIFSLSPDPNSLDCPVLSCLLQNLLTPSHLTTIHSNSPQIASTGIAAAHTATSHAALWGDLAVAILEEIGWHIESFVGRICVNFDLSLLLLRLDAL